MFVAVDKWCDGDVVGWAVSLFLLWLCGQMAEVNTYTMRGVGGMSFLRCLDWGLLPDDLASTASDGSDSGDSIPFMSCWEETASDAGKGGSVDGGEVVRVNINKLVETVCSCLCDTTIRVFKVPKAFTAP